MNKAFIFCDGLDEKLYFQQLPQLFRASKKITLEVTNKKGKSKTSLVNEIISSINHINKGPDDILCAVTDYDYHSSKTETDFTAAKKLAKENNIEFYFSNDSWDLWILLHFQDVDSNFNLTRDDIIKILKETYSYNKKDNTSKEKFRTSLNEETVRLAVSRARKLYKKNSYGNPSTNIYELVEKIIPEA